MQGTEVVNYHVEGNIRDGFAILDGVGKRGGGIVYDLLESRQLADAVCDALNRGVGPDWDDVEADLIFAGILPNS